MLVLEIPDKMDDALACFYTPTYLIQLYFPIIHHRQPLQWSKTNCTQTDREAKALKLQMAGGNQYWLYCSK